MLAPGTAPAQPELRPAGDEPVRQVHWAVGAFFGTGWYRVDENRTVYILRLQPRQDIRSAGWDESGRRRPGVEILYPVSLGLNKLDDVPDFIDFENYSTISFTPGVAVEVPVTGRWSLRPFAHVGYGWESEGQEGAWIWYGGVKSRFRLFDGATRWSLLSGLYYAGYKPAYRERGRYAAWMLGLESGTPLGEATLDGDRLFLKWHVTYDRYFDRLNFHLDPDRSRDVYDQWEIGLALGKRGAPIRLWFMEFEHIGLSYRFSSHSGFDAITVNLRSPFTY